MKLISAGYWAAAVDYLWIQNLGMIGSGKYSNETLKLTHDDYRLALDLDPDFYELYEQAGVLFSFFHESPDDAIEFLAAGIRRYESGLAPPDFWTHPATLYIFLAYTYAFQKNDWTRARETYLRAAGVQNSPLYLSKMKEWLKEKSSERILAIRVLKILIANTKDDFIRKKYEEKLKQYEP
ncbi:MAG: hypothetical protein JST80_09235 [Bdellovibrionales bacterium]|nr:hypothetical protein [Bdellovibrionales bacterium]